MKSLYLLFAAIVAFASLTFAQEKMLTVEDIFLPQPGASFNGKSFTAQWNADGTYRQFSGGQFVHVNAVTGEMLPMYDKSRFEAALVSVGISSDKAQKIAGQSQYTFNKTANALVVVSDNDLYYYELGGSGRARRLTNSKEEKVNIDFSPDGKWVSYVRGNNLYVVDVANGKEKQLTRDGGEGLLNGVLTWIYEEEVYGRGDIRGYWWSPDSSRIAFLHTDESMVPKFMVVDHIPTDQRLEDTHYPQPGDPMPIVTLGIADVTKTTLMPNVAKIPKVGKKLPGAVARFGDAVKFVDLSKYKPEDFLLVRVAWGPDSRRVFYQAQNREQTFLDLNSADIESGNSTTLIRDTTPASLRVIDNPLFLKDGSFIWQSVRSGFRHLYYYSNDGRLVRQLTDGRWEVRGLYGVDEKNGYAYFSASEYDPIANQIYRVKMDGTGFTRLSKAEGTHNATFSPDFTYFFDKWSDANTPQQTRLYRADGTLERIVNENKVDVLKNYKLSKPEFMRVRTRDGFAMEAMMIKPPDFNSNKKYPVMSFTYGGPHAQRVLNSWTEGGLNMWFQLLAQKGYIVWVCDNRSASGKGAEQDWTVYKNLGEPELKDLEEGLDYLRGLPYVDSSRFGIYGWSYGGFMTSYAMTHSKSFKMGISGGTVGDWRLYDSVYTERHMGLPQNNVAGYDKSSVIKSAKNLSGRLLLIHNTMDNNVHMQNTIQFVYELQKLGKQFDLMVYPTQRHGVADPIQQRHLYQMMTDYIVRNL